MNTKRIEFVKEFTDCPGGRLRIHGDYSGEQFREEVLKPALLNFDRVEVNLNGAYGFPSSFVDEAFGVLVEQIDPTVVRQKLVILLEDDPLAKREIFQVLDEHARLVA